MSVVEAFGEAAAAHRRCFWLDGGGAREWSGHRSLIGTLEPDDVSLTYRASTGEVTRHADGGAELVGTDIFTVLAEELAAGSHRDQWFGYFGYGCRPDLPTLTAPADDVPDAVWMKPSRVHLFEHGPGSVSPADRGNPLLSGVATPDKRQFPRLTGETVRAPEAYAHAFAQVQEHLHAGNSYEVNLTYRVDTVSPLDPVAAYLRLRSLNPAPYAGFLQHDVEGARSWLLSSSPERYALVTRDEDGRAIETKPIKGTTPRGATSEEDEELRRALATEPRFRAENLMITDLLRNDLAMVCDVGTVTVPTLLAVESYPTVHQLVSTVRGRLREDVSTVGALRALFPAGSMTGAPKLRTMEVIAQVETSPRAAYAGAFGWLAADGRADLGVIIRSLVTTGNGRYRLGTGGGITVQSTVEDEYAESRWKAERLLSALEGDTVDS